MEEICGKSFSKQRVSEAYTELDVAIDAFCNRCLKDNYLFVVVDATYIKVRENHRIVSKALMVAIGLTDGRSKVIGIFPNVSSVIRLMGAFLMEENERWKAKRKIYYTPACKELKAKIPTSQRLPVTKSNSEKWPRQ